MLLRTAEINSETYENYNSIRNLNLYVQSCNWKFHWQIYKFFSSPIPIEARKAQIAS